MNKEYILQRLEEIENDLTNLTIIVPNLENQNQNILDEFENVFSALNELTDAIHNQ